MKPSDKEIIRKIIMDNLGRKISIRMCRDAGAAGYSARNRVGEIFREELKPLGYTRENVFHDKAKGEEVFDNGWIISPPRVQIPVVYDERGQADFYAVGG